MSFIPNIGDKYTITAFNNGWDAADDIIGETVTIITAAERYTRVARENGKQATVFTWRLDPAEIYRHAYKKIEEPKLPITLHYRNDPETAPIVEVDISEGGGYIQVSLVDSYLKAKGELLLKSDEVQAFSDALTTAATAFKLKDQETLNKQLQKLTAKYNADVQALKDQYNA